MSPDTGVYRGHDAIREMFRMWRDTLEDARAEIEEFIDAGDAVVAPCWFCGGRHSGAQVREPYTYVMKWLDGQIVEWREYQTKPDALEAVGLKE